MGTLRSLGALARAVGPVVAASGEATIWPSGHAGGPARPLGGVAGQAGGCRWARGTVASPVVSTAYWLAGAHVCYTVCAALFLLPFSVLRTLSPPARTLKAE